MVSWILPDVCFQGDFKSRQGADEVPVSQVLDTQVCESESRSLASTQEARRYGVVYADPSTREAEIG